MKKIPKLEKERGQGGRDVELGPETKTNTYNLVMMNQAYTTRDKRQKNWNPKESPIQRCPIPT